MDPKTTQKTTITTKEIKNLVKCVRRVETSEDSEYIIEYIVENLKFKPYKRISEIYSLLMNSIKEYVDSLQLADENEKKDVLAAFETMILNIENDDVEYIAKLLAIYNEDDEKIEIDESMIEKIKEYRDICKKL